jgi:hypothetical protein
VSRTALARRIASSKRTYSRVLICVSAGVRLGFRRNEP